MAENLATIHAGGLIENLETRRVAQDGRVVDVALSAAPLVDPASDEVIGEICSMRDITEHKRAQQAEAELEQNRRLTQLIQTRLEEERRAIARELHDELGQSVTAIRTIGAAIANRTEGSDARDPCQRPHHRRRWRGTCTMWCTASSASCGRARWTISACSDALEGWVETWRSRYPDVALRPDPGGRARAIWGKRSTSPSTASSRSA